MERTAAASQAAIDISHLTISLGDNAGGTCLRLMGNFTYGFNDAIFEDANIGVGVAVVTKDAMSIGTMPDPLSDLEHDWYYWHAWEGIVGLENQHEQTFDIRSARKLREGYRLAFISQNFTQELSTTLRVRLRTLWTLE